MKIKPFKALFICASLFYFPLQAQDPFLIFGQVHDSMFVHELEGIELNPGDNGNLTYNIDIDYDNIWDLRIWINFSSGHWGGSGGIWLKAYNGTQFTADTLAVQWIGPGGNLSPDTATTVYKHSYGDTLWKDDRVQYYSEDEVITQIDVWTDPWYKAVDLDDWVGGDNYIGIKKLIDGEFRLGWIKAEVVVQHHIIFKEIALDYGSIKTPRVRINEYMIYNKSTITDEYGEYDGWIEIYNPEEDSVWLGSFHLTNNIYEGEWWRMPPVYLSAKGFALIWTDNQTDQGLFHADFSLKNGYTVMGISDLNKQILEKQYMAEYYPDISEGRLPDGSGGLWEFFPYPTPGYSNGVYLGIKINEFMADNINTIADEYGEYDDWIELYNPNDHEVFLGDHWMTDDTLVPRKWRMPDVYLNPHDFLIIWADNQPEQGPLHANFKLDDDGESIGIYPSSIFRKEDEYTFTFQTSDVSEGRLPNGADNWNFLKTPTPGTSNNPTDLPEFEDSDVLKAFPNPSINQMVYLSKTTTFNVINSSGQVVLENITGNTIDLTRLPSGLYVLISEEGERITLIK